MTSSTQAQQTGLTFDIYDESEVRPAKDVSGYATAFARDPRRIAAELIQGGARSSRCDGTEASQSERKRNSRSRSPDAPLRLAKKVRVTHEVDMDQFSLRDKLALFRELIKDKSLRGQLVTEIASSLKGFETYEIQTVVKLGCRRLRERDVDPHIEINTMTSRGVNTVMQDCCNQLSHRNDQITIGLELCKDQQIKDIYRKCCRELQRRGLPYKPEVRKLSIDQLVSLLSACYAQLYSRAAEDRINFHDWTAGAVSSVFQRSAEALIASGHEIPIDMTKWQPEQLASHLQTLLNELRRWAGEQGRGRRLCAHQFISIADQCCILLMSRGYALPWYWNYQIPVPPNLLNITQELRDQIYELCGPEYLTHQNRISGSRGFTLRAIDAGSQNRYDRPAKRRRLATGSAKKPDVLLKFEGPTQFPSLSFTCRQLREELIAAAFARYPLGIKVDCDGLDPADAIVDFWEAALPYRHLDVIHTLNVEIRCSVEQWHQMNEPLCIRLRKMTKLVKQPTGVLETRAHVRIRVYLAYPSHLEHAHLQSLPPSYDKDLKDQAIATWFKGHTRALEDNFKVLQNIACVHQIEILNFRPQVSKPKRVKSYASDIRHFTVLSREGDGWKRLRSFRYTSEAELSHYIKIEDKKITEM